MLYFFFRGINKKKTPVHTTRAFIYSPQTWVVRAMETHWVACFFPSLNINIYIYIYLVRRISPARTASYFLLNYITVSRLCSTTTSIANYPRVHFILEFLSRPPPSSPPCPYIYCSLRGVCYFFSLVSDGEKSHSSPTPAVLKSLYIDTNRSIL